MSRHPSPEPPAPRRPAEPASPLHTVQVLGGGSAGTGAHVRSLAAGLAARGLRVTVCAPRGAQTRYDFTGAGARFVAASPRSEPEAVTVLRETCEHAGLVHAHGLRAGLLAVLALGRRLREVPLVVTWHTRGHAEGVRAALMSVLEKRVARAATVVLCATSDLVARARGRGARDARLAPVAGPGPRGAGPAPPPVPLDERRHHKARAEVGAVDRPLLFAAGRLEAARGGWSAALTAARAWRHLDPPPLLAVAGEGEERTALQRRVDAEELPVRFLGRRDDALELLAVADVAVLPSRWEARSFFAQEALRAGVPLVATAVGGTPELVGDSALLVPYGDGDALAAAVSGLLGDQGRRAALAAAGPARAAGWPTEDDTVAQVLSVYDELTAAAG